MAHLSSRRVFLELVSKCVTPELLSRIAQEYAKGRLLLVGTTDLDAGSR
jgi:hypothetical protein